MIDELSTFYPSFNGPLLDPNEVYLAMRMAEKEQRLAKRVFTEESVGEE